MSDEPLIYTSKGNLPIASLKYETDWVVGDTFYKFVERYRDETDEVVRESAHVYSTKGISASGEAGSF